MNEYKIGKIVEYIKSFEDFCYDVDDVIEGIQDILTEYEIHSVFTDDEYYELLEELLELAERSEIAEAVKWAELELVTGQDSGWGTDYRIPNI